MYNVTLLPYFILWKYVFTIVHEKHFYKNKQKTKQKKTPIKKKNPNKKNTNKTFSICPSYVQTFHFFWPCWDTLST